MGHGGHIRGEYRSLVERLRATQLAYPEPKNERSWDAWKEILEILYTPEEAELASRLPVLPATLEQIARRVDLPPEQLRARLDVMCDKGVVVDVVNPKSGVVRYVLSPPIVGFLEFSMMRVRDDGLPKKRLAEAMEAYMMGDEAFAQEAFGGATVVGRALVHETALADDALPDVLDFERATAVIGDARSHAVAHCFCRHEAHHLGRPCDAPMENCLSLDIGADWVVRRGFGRRIERGEALELLHQAREHGLVQIADNVQRLPTYVCNCCGCCCGQLRAVSRWGLPAVNPSRFGAAYDAASCKGCARCARACPVTAIAMTPQRQAAHRKNAMLPVIDGERCIGCGVCVDACRNHAMRMAPRPKPPTVPRSTVERVLNMALERGRLAHFIDENAGRGSWFLHHAVSALMALPGVKRAVASEQLKSRFVRAAMTRIKDPSG